MHESGALLLDPQDLYRLDRGLYSQAASSSVHASHQGALLSISHTSIPLALHILHCSVHSTAPSMCRRF